MKAAQESVDTALMRIQELMNVAMLGELRQHNGLMRGNVYFHIERWESSHGRCTEHPYKKVSRSGDLLIGFAALDGPTPSFQLRIGAGITHEGMKHAPLAPGEMRMAVDDGFVLPLVGMQYHDVYIDAAPSADLSSLWMLYATVDWSTRCELARKPLSAQLAGKGDSTLYITSGLCGLCSMSKADTIRLARVDLELPSRTRTNARLELLKPGIMEAAWHPERMRRWCLEHDDEFFDGAGRK